MTTATDVAELIKSKMPGVDKLKLQKLVYYTQAWSLAWRRAPMFNDPIEAWRHGPVVRDVYEGKPGDASRVQGDELTVVDVVLAHYGTHSGAWLRDLTHREPPWRDARKGLSPEQRSNRQIPLDSLRAFYRSTHPFGFDEGYLRGLEVLVETPEDELADLLSAESVAASEFLAFLESGDECVSSK